MKRFVISGGTIWLIVGLGMFIESINLGLGKLNKPGPGFMPFLSGMLLGIFGLVLMFYPKREGPDDVNFEEKGNVLKKVFPTLLALFGYTFLLEILGFIITSILFLFALLEITEGRKWGMHFIFAIVIVFFSYLIFSVWLMVLFPRGIFRF